MLISRKRNGRGGGTAALLLLLAAACAEPPAVIEPAAPAEPHADERAALQAFEDETRASTDFAALPPWSERAGADPWAVAEVGGRTVGLLRGAAAVVVLDQQGKETARAAAPRLASALAVAADGELFVAGEGENAVARLRIDDRGAIRSSGSLVVRGARSLRAAAWAPPGVLYLADRGRGEIVRVRPTTGEVDAEPVARCEGAIALVNADGWLVATCLLERSVWLRRLGPDGLPQGPELRVVHDGPIWAADARARKDGVLLALAGVEDRPLDRSDGSFGWVDSMLYLTDVAPCAEELCARRFGELDVSDHGVVVPKHVALSLVEGSPHVVVAGYGGGGVLEADWGPGGGAPSAVATRELPPGLRAMIGSASAGIAADPLIDRWVVWQGGGGLRMRAPADARDERPFDVRVGEALFFTTMMAPWNPSEGRASRFTCETCHFEGTVDGRTHHTGRGDVHATTKPLLGLFNNRPHFTRALDPSLAVMVDNEFRVANRASGRDPWFSVQTRDFTWLGAFGDVPREVTAIELRKALMAFLMAFTHDPNPAVRGRDRFTDAERSGARLFRDHCERCHQARLSTDDASTRVDFDRWEALVLDPRGPVVWASPERQKTGVVPYVHEAGARTTSLRRAWLKRPYFTSGSASTLDEVLANARVAARVGDAFAHAGEVDGGRPLTGEERAALRAFVELL